MSKVYTVNVADTYGECSGPLVYFVARLISESFDVCKEYCLAHREEHYSPAYLVILECELDVVEKRVIVARYNSEHAEVWEGFKNEA
jgi:hypothetical protein